MQLILTLTLTPKPILTKSNLNNNVHVPTSGKRGRFLFGGVGKCSEMK
jgi:hypothetical protein